MSHAKNQILQRIRSGLGRPALTAEQSQALQTRLTQPTRNIMPKRAQAKGTDAIAMFTEMALEAATEIINIDSLAAIPKHVSDIIGAQAEQTVVLANEACLQQLDWAGASITPSTRVATKGDTLSLTLCQAGVAETGTLVLSSSSTSPTTLNFLPDTHCVVLREQDIIGSYEDAWDLVRQGDLPRTVNFITGPSRSADLEQKLQMGAHGPKRLVIFLLQS